MLKKGAIQKFVVLGRRAGLRETGLFSAKESNVKETLKQMKGDTNMRKYIAVIANNKYFGETLVTRIFTQRPTIQEIYKDFDQDAEDLGALYHQWVIIVNSIDSENVTEVARLTYHDTKGDFKNDYIVSGSGYLYEQHVAMIQKRTPYSEHVLSRLCLAEETSSDGGVKITIKASSYADAIIQIENTCTLRLSHADASKFAGAIRRSASICEQLANGVDVTELLSSIDCEGDYDEH